MPDPASFKHSKLAPQELDVCRRLRSIREHLKFSLGELAAECELSKSGLAHFERGIAPLNFESGNRIARRLNVNQRWLATGNEPQYPYVPLVELSAELAKQIPKGRLTFRDAYSGPLKASMERWLAGNPDRISTGSSSFENRIRLSSPANLENELEVYAKMLTRNHTKSEKAGALKLLMRVAFELERWYSRTKEVDQPDQLGQLSAMQIQERLKALRAKLGLTQEQASKRWNVPVSTLKKWERGSNKPRGLGMRQLETILRTGGSR